MSFEAVDIDVYHHVRYDESAFMSLPTHLPGNYLYCYCLKLVPRWLGCGQRMASLNVRSNSPISGTLMPIRPTFTSRWNICAFFALEVKIEHPFPSSVLVRMEQTSIVGI